jgi:hypothetical protein
LFFLNLVLLKYACFTQRIQEHINVLFFNNKHCLPDWLCKIFLVLCRCAPSQGIVPKLRKHLSSENVQTQHQYPGGILDGSWI